MNHDVIHAFQTMNASGRLFHSYVFVGPHDTGKTELARSIAAVLVDTSRFPVTAHPDVLFVSRERDQKTHKLKKDISVSQIHDIIHFFQFGPTAGTKKIVIIQGLHLLSTAAANALLKTLESLEPWALLIGTTEDESRIVPTILSRSHVMILTKDYAPANKNTDEEPREEEMQRFFTLLKTPSYARLGLITDIFGDKTDHIAARMSLMYILRDWQRALREFQTRSDRLAWDRYVALMDSMSESLTLLEKNVHPKLLIERILLLIP